MFKALLRDKAGNEQWDVFYPIDDNWPSEGALTDYEVGGIVFILRYCQAADVSVPVQCTVACITK
jgi:hypothetical protein